MSSFDLSKSHFFKCKPLNLLVSSQYLHLEKSFQIMVISKLSTIVLLTLTLPSQAFIPSNHQKQLTIGTSMSVQGSAPTSPLHFAGTNTALQANLFDRFFRVANANLNKLVNSLEDPEKVIAQTVQEMQVRKLQSVTCIRAVMSSQLD